ncbi:uncharacterized protein TNCV_4228871 [Trichonephila clavipes]|nr:uncharacterized protein TNCV_4228871 [Trichonephila clavipes]
MPSFGGYHPYRLVSILTELESIEHVWDMLGRRLAARQPHPICLPELRSALLDEWCNIPQDQIDNLIVSMPRRYKNHRASNWVNVKALQNKLFHEVLCGKSIGRVQRRSTNRVLRDASEAVHHLAAK